MIVQNKTKTMAFLVIFSINVVLFNMRFSWKKVQLLQYLMENYKIVNGTYQPLGKGDSSLLVPKDDWKPRLLPVCDSKLQEDSLWRFVLGQDYSLRKSKAHTQQQQKKYWKIEMYSTGP